jgi:hypothetical protein
MFTIRLTESEHASLHAQARKAGIPAVEFVRTKVLSNDIDPYTVALIAAGRRFLAAMAPDVVADTTDVVAPKSVTWTSSR